MKRKKKKSSENTKLAVVFFVLIAGIVVFSFILKLITLVSQSQFDSIHRFTISLSNSKNLEVVSFSPASRSISILKLDEDKSLNFYRFLEIPIDAKVQADFANVNKSPAEILFATLFNYKNVVSDINVVDIAKLLLFAKTVSPEHIYEKHLPVGSDSEARDKISSSLFSDDKVSEENARIEIVNAAGAPGVGVRLARLINNMGGNVVLVSTGGEVEKKSLILYSGRRTYTLLRLEKLLGFPIEKNTASSIGNVIIRIGEDGTNIKY